MLALGAALLSGCGVGALLVGGGVTAGVLLSDDDGSSPASAVGGSPFLSPPPARETLRARGESHVVPICYQGGGAEPQGLAFEHARESEDFDTWRAATPVAAPPAVSPCAASTFWWAAGADLGLAPGTAARVRVRVHRRGRADIASVSETFAVGNTPAEVQFIPISVAEASGDITLSFNARDAEGDPLHDVKLSLEENGAEVEVVLKAPDPGEPALPPVLPAPETGFIHSGQWDSRSAIGNRNLTDLRIRLHARDGFGEEVVSDLPPFTLRNNRPAEARLAPISDADDTSFGVPISFRLLDLDHHAVDVVVQYVIEDRAAGGGEPAFEPLPPEFLDASHRAHVLASPGGEAERARLRIATPLNGSSALALAATAAGVNHRFVWDSLEDLKTPASTSVRVRLTPFDADAGQDTETISPFVVRNDIFASEIRLGDALGLVTGTAAGDLDGDGRLDVALALLAAPVHPGDAACAGDLGRIDVFLRSIDGSFAQPPLHLRPGSAAPCGSRDRGPADVLIADIDGDGASDLAALSTGCALDDCPNIRGEVSIFFGPLRPEATPGAPDITLSAGADVRSLAAGNIDEDGLLDLVVSNHRRLDGPPVIPRSVSLFRHTAPRSFAPMDLFSDCDDPECEPGLLACADLDGDGRDEIAVRQDEPARNRVLLLQWRPELRQLVTLSAVQLPLADREHFDFSPISVAAADLDPDAGLELVVGSRNLKAIYSFTIGADGEHGTPRKWCLSAPPERISVADTDGDGTRELFAVEPERLGGTIEVVSASAPGCCDEPCLLREIAVPLPGPGVARPAGVTVADLSGDGYADLLLGTSDGARLLVSAGPGSLEGSRPRTLRVRPGSQVRDLAFGDCNGDGLADLAAAAYVSESHHEILLFLGRDRDGLPDAPSRVLRASPGEACHFQDSLYLELDDLDADGAADLMAFSRAGGLDLYWRGAGGFSSDALVQIEDCGQGFLASKVAFGRFGGAGVVDILRLGLDSLTLATVELVNEDGGIRSVRVDEEVPWSTRSPPQAMARADFNADGLADLALLYGATRSLAIAFQASDGAWPDRLQPGPAAPAGVRDGSLVPVQLRQDDRAGLLLLPFEGEAALGFSCVPGEGGGPDRLQQAFRLEAGGVPLGAAVSDWNGDGRRDIILGVVGRSRLLVFHQRQDGGVGPLSSWGIEVGQPLQQRSRLAAQDFTGDGSADVAVSFPGTESIVLLEAR